MTTGYRIAGRMSRQDLTRIDGDSHFSHCISDVLARYRPQRIIETGTYLGNGTTTIIARAIRRLQIPALFYSIEVNPIHVERATENLARSGLEAKILSGLSVPREMLPTVAQIEHEYVRSVVADGIVVDHEAIDRGKLYFRETDFPHRPDDLLGRVLAEFEFRPDFVLLDSGGHMGHIEFRYVIDKLRGPCIVVLDDIHHVKHYRSFQDLRADDRFEVLVASDEKFGFCIARFNP